jgi:Protein of unknown function (DUF 659)
MFLLQHRTKEIVAKDAELFGMCLLGDGATVRGMPLMNVIVSTPNACSVLDIIDCTEHMEAGGKKDAKYIADMFQEHISSLDPKGIHLNAVLFDGASNVQKAGRVIEASYPQVSVLHGIEHVVSLFFSDLSKLPFVRFLILNYRRVYRVFGSGSMHSPYAMFQKNSQTFNGGRKIGLVRAADTRMAGYFYAFHRMLRLQPALKATVSSVEFKGLKLSKSVVIKAVKFIEDKEMWNALHCLTRCLFPALRVLRLADKSEPGFDCLYYFVRKTDKAMEYSTRAFETVSYFSTAVNDPSVLDDLLRDGHDADGLRDDDDDKDDDELASMLRAGHDEDGEGLSDDESTLGVPLAATGEQFGRNIKTLWAKRKVNMVSDFCIAGWLLSPLEEVMVDVKTARNGDSNNAMDRILNKMYHNRTDDELGVIKDLFWTEWNEFNSKTGRYGHGRKYIWNSELIRNRKSAQWHAQYSVVFTEVRGDGCLFWIINTLSLTITASCCHFAFHIAGTWQGSMSNFVCLTRNRCCRTSLGCCEASQVWKEIETWG